MIQNACSQGDKYVFDFLAYLYENSKKSFIVCVVPRAKPDKSTHFKEFITTVTGHVWHGYDGGAYDHINDGVDYIARILPTRTTHFRTPDGGSNPYPGITKDTCVILKKELEDKIYFSLMTFIPITIGIHRREKKKLWALMRIVCKLF